MRHGGKAERVFNVIAGGLMLLLFAAFVVGVWRYVLNL